jgi:hypothetical protein
VAKRSLFSILIELPWWFSLLVAGLVYSVGAFFQPIIGAAAALPFLGVAGYIGWLRLKRGPIADFPDLIRALRAASPEEMRAMLAEAFTQQRYEVADGAAGDLELQRNGYRTLVRFRRWRAQSTSPAVLVELAAAVRARGADHGIYVTAGAVSDAARNQAAASGITLLDAMALANLVVRTRGARKAVSRSHKEAVRQ